MAQDHFKTPPDPKKGNGIIKNPQKKSKESSRAGQEIATQTYYRQTVEHMHCVLFAC